MEHSKEIFKHWKELLDKPREDLLAFAADIFYNYTRESGTKFVLARIGDYTVLPGDYDIKCPQDFYEVHMMERLLVFIHESFEAELIKNKATQITNGEAFYKAFVAFMELRGVQIPPEIMPKPIKKFTEEEGIKRVSDFLDAKENLEGYINPAEVVGYL